MAVVPVVDKSPSQIGYVLGVECVQCGTYVPLKKLYEANGTLLQYICDLDWSEYVPRLDIERLMGILNPTVARQRFEASPTYWGLFPELLPLVWDDGKPRIHTPDVPFSSLHKSKQIGNETEVPNLYFLDDGDIDSFKTRAVTAAVNFAKDSKYDTMVVASTGNLVRASLIIGHAAGLDVYALLPQALSNGKKRSISDLAEKLGITPDHVQYFPKAYDEINNIDAERLIDGFNGSPPYRAFSPNRGTRIWYGMGEWTAAFQLITQLYYQQGIERDVPINIYIGGGSGKLTSMVTEACKVLQQLNILQNPIRVWSVQPTVNQPLVQGYNEQVLPRLNKGKQYEEFKEHLYQVQGKNPQGTIVEEVAIRTPGSFLHTMKSLANPNSPEIKDWKGIRGGAVAVDDSVTLDGIIELVLKEGLTPQFVGGMAYQGFRQVVEQHPELREEIHVVYLTGGGKGKLRLTLEEMASKGRWEGGGVVLDVSGREEKLLKIAPFFNV